MQAVKSENTAIEWQVRHWLHAHGYRYRLHGRNLPGHPDLVFSRRRKVVFIHGCFWHGHSCPRGRRVPKTNTDYWTAKIRRNVARDNAAQRRLEELGWQSSVVWECELTKDPGAVFGKLSGFLGNGNEPDLRMVANGE
jgi:DNA mismatch endonuclease (patch repair protein)